MTNLYLDVEFNGTRGEMISLALYDPLSGDNFYEVCRNWEDMKLIEWVKRNVIPVTGKPGIRYTELQTALVQYLTKIGEDIVIYADWPEDFIHLLDLLFVVNSGGAGKHIQRMRMELITTPDTHKPEIPHNALSDAKALYLNHMSMKV